MFEVAAAEPARADRAAGRVDLLGHAGGLGRAVAGLLGGTADPEVAALGEAGTGSLRVVG